MLTVLMLSVLTRFLPVVDGLDRTGQSVLGVALCGMLLWIAEIVPIGVTALVVLVLLGTIPGLHPTHVFGGFALPVVFFLIGAVGIAAAVEQTGYVSLENGVGGVCHLARRPLANPNGKESVVPSCHAQSNSAPPMEYAKKQRTASMSPRAGPVSMQLGRDVRVVQGLDQGLRRCVLKKATTLLLNIW